jgi:hypothetical protein
MLRELHCRVGLFLITQHFSLRVPDLQSAGRNNAIRGIGLKRLDGMTTMSRDAKKSKP